MANSIDVAEGHPARWDIIDAARGAAIVAMIAYHFGWDLSLFGFIDVDVGMDPAWQWFARFIAGSFLALVGVGLVLAHGRAFRRRAFLRRLGIIGAAALAVTLATLVAFPDRYIYFGILHCIALGSVLALPFLRAPLPVILLLAVAAIAAPSLLASPALNAPVLAFLGLGTVVPPTNDYVPLFPWLGLVLAGFALGRWVTGARPAPLVRWRAKGLIGKTLVWAGRYSLPIYLTHQIVLLGLLFLVSQAIGSRIEPGESAFLRPCAANCVSGGRSAELCRATCDCVAEELKTENLWADTIADRLGPEESTRVQSLARQCFARQLRLVPPPAP